MKSIIDFIIEKQNFIIKGHTKNQNKPKRYSEDFINIGLLMSSIQIANKLYIGSVADKRKLADFIKGTQHHKTFTIRFQDGYIHIFRYEDMKAINLSLQATNKAEYPDNWDNPTMYTMNNMVTASKRELVNEFEQMICSDKKSEILLKMLDACKTGN